MTYPKINYLDQSFRFQTWEISYQSEWWQFWCSVPGSMGYYHRILMKPEGAYLFLLFGSWFDSWSLMLFQITFCLRLVIRYFFYLYEWFFFTCQYEYINQRQFNFFFTCPWATRTQKVACPVGQMRKLGMAFPHPWGSFPLLSCCKNLIC